MSEQKPICKLIHTASISFKPKMLNNLANNMFSYASIIEEVNLSIHHLKP